MGEPVVRNAADEKQVRDAEVKEKLGRAREINDLFLILQENWGRRFVWRLLVNARVFESIWEPSAKIHYLAGRQDFGHYILAEIMEASPDAYLKMMLEAKAEEQARSFPQNEKEK